MRKRSTPNVQIRRFLTRLAVALLGGTMAVVGVGFTTAGAATNPATKPDTVKRFEKALDAYSACVKAELDADDGDASTCARPDPSDFGLKAGPEPDGVKQFRGALEKFRECLAKHDEDPRKCGQPPSPEAFGLKTVGEPAQVRKFRDEVQRYADCAKKHNGKTASCGARPDPAKHGLKPKSKP